MKQPFWRHCLSYLTSVKIEDAESAYNPLLRVVFKRGQYQLLSANAIYSYGTRYDNFSKAFDRLDFDRLDIQDVLVLGLGLGSIPYMLETKYGKKFHYTTVEIDPEVMRLANKYVMRDMASSIEFHLSDADNFVAFSEDKFNLICMDVFLDDAVPTELEQEDFLVNLKNLLSPEGILMFNKLAFFKKDKRAAEAFFQNHFKRIFTEGVYLDVDGNYILLNRGDFLKS